MDLEMEVRPYEVVRPWLFLGPILLKEFKDIYEFLVSSPYEGLMVQTAENQEMSWQLLRQESIYYWWGLPEGGMDNIFATVLLSTRVQPKDSKTSSLKIFSLSSNRILVSLNGKVIYDSSDEGKELLDIEVPIAWKDDENILNLGLILSRTERGVMKHLGLSILTDSPLRVRIAQAPHMSWEERKDLEEKLEEISLSKILLYPSDSLKLEVPHQTTFEVIIKNAKGEKVMEKKIDTVGEVSICEANKLEEGKYHLICTWKDRDDRPLTSKSFYFYKVFDRICGKNMSFEERKLQLLKLFVEKDYPKFDRDRIWGQVARYFLGKGVDEEVIRKACEHVNKRRDCSDFILQGILRLLFWDKEKHLLSEQIKEEMKACILNFKYWVDESGTDNMYMDTENHRLLFHTAEWLAGLLYPNEVFSNSGQNGVFHALKGKTFLSNWLEARGRFGFDEWHSNVYIPIILSALLNIYDFAPPEEHEIWIKTKQLLDILMTILYQDSYHGIFGTPHGRTYEAPLLYPELCEISTIVWLLSGEGYIAFSAGIGLLSLCTSKYEPPFHIFKHLDTFSKIESRYRQGNLTIKRLSANYSVYKTPHYMVSGLTDFQKGYYFHLHRMGRRLKTGALSYWSYPFPHISFAQVTLPRGISIVWSCPITDREGYYYWLNASLPKVLHYRNLLILIFKGVPWITHCYFDKKKFEKVVQKNGWVFGKVEESYIGIFSEKGLDFRKNGQFKDRELICSGNENVWIARLSDADEYTSFEEFVELTNSNFKFEKEKEVYKCYMPGIGEVVFSWDWDYLIVNDEEIPQSGYSLFSTPSLQSEYGSGCVVVVSKEGKTEYWF